MVFLVLLLTVIAFVFVWMSGGGVFVEIVKAREFWWMCWWSLDGGYVVGLWTCGGIVGIVVDGDCVCVGVVVVFKMIVLLSVSMMLVVVLNEFVKVRRG